MHYYSLSSVNGDVICYGPLLEVVDGVLKASVVRVSSVYVSCDGGVIDILPTMASVTQSIVDK